MKTVAKLRMEKRPSRQNGFSLIVTLILLMIVTLLGVAASQLVLQSERTARYDRDYQVAYQAAEAALKDAEMDIRGPNTYANQRMADFAAERGKEGNVWVDDGCGKGSNRGKCVSAPEGAKAIWYTVDFTNTDNTNRQVVEFGEFTGRTFSSGDDFPGINSGIRPELKPRYIIERIRDFAPGQPPEAIVYRVTAVGFGPRKETQAVLQTIFRKD